MVNRQILSGQISALSFAERRYFTGDFAFIKGIPSLFPYLTKCFRQSFLPKETALEGYGEILRLCQRRGMVSYLGVLKRHFISTIRHTTVPHSTMKWFKSTSPATLSETR